MCVICKPLGALVLVLAMVVPAMADTLSPADVSALYASRVDRQLQLPADEARRYAQLTEQALATAAMQPQQAQFIAVVDRSPKVQALLLYWRSARAAYEWLGASPVSTGVPGRFDHFKTPLGVFVHSLDNPDFRAEGTYNSHGIRGYGRRGLRVFDFGWQPAPKGWGNGATIDMRLQMHATEPDGLEQKLGSAQSKGCIRIPATLNQLLDHLGLLDADYLAAPPDDRRLWVLAPQRQPVPDAGRLLVILETQRDTRPTWSPAPLQAPPTPRKLGSEPN